MPCRGRGVLRLSEDGGRTWIASRTFNLRPTTFTSAHDPPRRDSCHSGSVRCRAWLAALRWRIECRQDLTVRQTRAACHTLRDSKGGLSSRTGAAGRCPPPPGYCLLTAPGSLDASARMAMESASSWVAASTMTRTSGSGAEAQEHALGVPRHSAATASATAPAGRCASPVHAPTSALDERGECRPENADSNHA